MTLSLPRAMVDQVMAHARRDHPDECCGVISASGGVARRVFEMENADRSPTGFTFGDDMLGVYRDIDDADEEPWIVYHSHTATEAYPSRTDVRWAATAGFPYWLVVSTRSDEDEARAYTILDGVVTEVDLELT
jgi:proteasome lid subunit RPN8/RPN11